MSLLLLLRNGGSEPEPEVVAPRRLNVVERAPMRQYIVATSPNGAVNRWGGDEPDAVDIPEELTDSDTSPGGNKTLTAALPRLPGVSYDDMRMGTRLEVFGAGQHKVSEYRLERDPRTSGDYLVIDPAASGCQALLSDKEEAWEIFLDSELGGWGAPPSERRKRLIELGRKLVAGVATGFSGTTVSQVASIIFEFTGTSLAAGGAVGEAWYSSGGIDIGRVLADYRQMTANLSPDPKWRNEMWVSKDAGGATAVGGTNFEHGAAVESSLTAPEPGYVYAFLENIREETLGGEWQNADGWSNLKVLGRHGLPLYGTWPQIGVLASDVIAYALSMWAPGLRFTTGPYGSLKPSRFAIPHLVFTEPTTVQEIVSAALKFELLEWGVWPGQFGPTFYLNERGKREGAKRWRTRVRPAKLTEAGQQMDQLYNQVVMSWQDPGGSTKTMGPLGSGFPYTDSRCEDLDPENALNEAGVIRTKHLTMNGVGTAEGAAEQARLFLEKCRLLDGSGEATLTGYVEDEHGIEWPYYHVHAGDTIEFIDSSIPGARYIVEATRSRKSRSVNIKLDAPPDSYEAILAELQVRETAAGFGS